MGQANYQFIKGISKGGSDVVVGLGVTNPRFYGTNNNVGNIRENATIKGNEGEEKNKQLTIKDAEKYAFDAIKGPDNADAVVLGKYERGSASSYDVVARDMNAQYFNLDNWDDLSSKYSNEEIWKINERFLDIQTSSGREIYLSHSPKDYIERTSYYTKEINYLIDNGYRFVDEGGIWHALR